LSQADQVGALVDVVRDTIAVGTAPDNTFNTGHFASKQPRALRYAGGQFVLGLR
jgi:hypothetical protein